MRTPTMTRIVARTGRRILSGTRAFRWLPKKMPKKSRFLVSGGGVRRTPGIGTEEQIAERATQEVCDPALCEVVRAVVEHVTALA